MALLDNKLDGGVASAIQQVWQGLGADEGNRAVSGELLQLDLAA